MGAHTRNEVSGSRGEKYNYRKIQEGNWTKRWDFQVAFSGGCHRGDIKDGWTFATEMSIIENNFK